VRPADMESPQRAGERAGRTGLWLIGGRGSVATTAVCGLAALRGGLTDATGCVTGRLDLSGSIFPGWADLVVGGQDIASTPVEKAAGRLAEAGLLPQRILPQIADELRAVDAAIRPGYDPAADNGSQAAAAARQIADIQEFKQVNDLARVVVVNVASTEPPRPDMPEYHDLDALTQALASPAARPLTASSLALYAALEAGCPVVDFTPSPGLCLPAITELARRRGLPYAGRDGKTGETLLRTALAPVFTDRALRVRSWSGTNLLGGGDGANLADPGRVRGKLESKARGLAALLGPEVTAPLHIDHVPDLGERKVAWDYVSFEGFLGVQMSMQFSWDGYDSALAAPLVLDLARLVAGAHQAGETGPLGALGFFFKDPLGSTEHRLAAQAAALSAWTARLSGHQ
jgi:myo-inositol-1-phosphate synthase